MQKQGQCIAGKLVWKTDKRRSPARFLNITWHLETHKPKQLSPDAQPVKTSILLGGGEGRSDASPTPMCCTILPPGGVMCSDWDDGVEVQKKSLKSYLLPNFHGHPAASASLQATEPVEDVISIIWCQKSPGEDVYNPQTWAFHFYLIVW